MQPFSTKGSIRETWGLFKQHWGIVWGAFLVMALINIPFNIRPKDQDTGTLLLFSLVAFVVSRYLQLGFMRLVLNVVRGTTASITQLFGEHRILLRFLGASIVYGLIVFAGILLLIVPGIVWSIKYSYYGYFILDKNLGVLDSIKMSGKVTDGAKMKLFGIGLVMSLLILVSMIPLGLGLIATIPMAALLTPVLYVRLLQRHEGDRVVAEPSREQVSEQTEVPKPPAPSSEEGAKPM